MHVRILRGWERGRRHGDNSASCRKWSTARRNGVRRGAYSVGLRQDSGVTTIESLSGWSPLENATLIPSVYRNTEWLAGVLELGCLGMMDVAEEINWTVELSHQF